MIQLILWFYSSCSSLFSVFQLFFFKVQRTRRGLTSDFTYSHKKSESSWAHAKDEQQRTHALDESDFFSTGSKIV